MSDATLSKLERLVGDAVSSNVRPAVSWLKWLICCVILGTTAVVGFVRDTNDGIAAAMKLIEQHESGIKDLNKEIKVHEREISAIQGRLGIASSNADKRLPP